MFHFGVTNDFQTYPLMILLSIEVPPVDRGEILRSFKKTDIILSFLPAFFIAECECFDKTFDEGFPFCKARCTSAVTPVQNDDKVNSRKIYHASEDDCDNHIDIQ